MATQAQRDIQRVDFLIERDLTPGQGNRYRIVATLGTRSTYARIGTDLYETVDDAFQSLCTALTNLIDREGERQIKEGGGAHDDGQHLEGDGTP